MNHLKLFENFNREQPLEKKDIEDLLEGTGINYSKIYEYPIRNVEERVFYLGWVVICENPNDWVYHSPRNYQVNIGENRIEFVWTVKPNINIDTLLSKLTPDWKQIKEWLLDLFKDMKKVESDSGFKFYKEDKFLFEQDLKNEWFWISYDNIWSALNSKYQIDYNIVKILLLIILEHVFNNNVISVDRMEYKFF
jgi:hypothetical protein